MSCTIHAATSGPFSAPFFAPPGAFSSTPYIYTRTHERERENRGRSNSLEDLSSRDDLATNSRGFSPHSAKSACFHSANGFPLKIRSFLRREINAARGRTTYEWTLSLSLSFFHSSAAICSLTVGLFDFIEAVWSSLALTFEEVFDVFFLSLSPKLPARARGSSVFCIIYYKVSANVAFTDCYI